MNALQFQVAMLEAQQRSRRAIETFTENMTPPQTQGGQNAANPQQQIIPNEENGQRNNGSQPGDVSAGQLY